MPYFCKNPWTSFVSFYFAKFIVFYFIDPFRPYYFCSLGWIYECPCFVFAKGIYSFLCRIDPILFFLWVFYVYHFFPTFWFVYWIISNCMGECIRWYAFICSLWSSRLWMWLLRPGWWNSIHYVVVSDIFLFHLCRSVVFFCFCQFMYVRIFFNIWVSDFVFYEFHRSD